MFDRVCPRRAAFFACFAFFAAWVFAASAQQANLEEIVLGDSCITADCHAGMKTDAEFLHGPFNLRQCAPCHEPVNDRHVFRPRPPAEGPLCYTCHQQEPAKSVVHQPFVDNCVLCHDPHGSDNRYFVKGGTGAENCNLCHSDVRRELDFVHGPAAVGECLVCHTPHQSDFGGLLVEPREQLCKSCHQDMEQRIQGAVAVHQPVAEDCEGCHQPHGGMNRFFLKTEGQELCRECHGEFLERTDKFKFTHKPMTEEKGCENCHDPHASNQQALLFQPTEQLCLACHNQEIETEEGTVPNVAAQIQNAKFLHGPIQENNCIACHEAHGSDHARLLEKEFPENFYAEYDPGTYELCFSCHDRKLIEQEKTTTTGFRNGNLNLHFLHANRKKGRSCRACHHEHATDQPKHIREEVPFGRWMMPIKFEITASGGTCTTGCHLPYSYDRETPVDNRTP